MAKSYSGSGQSIQVKIRDSRATSVVSTLNVMIGYLPGCTSNDLQGVSVVNPDNDPFFGSLYQVNINT